MAAHPVKASHKPGHTKVRTTKAKKKKIKVTIRKY